MTAQTPTVLKTYFETGDFPSEQQFANLIDSSVNVLATAQQIITSPFEISYSYSPGSGGTIPSLSIGADNNFGGTTRTANTGKLFYISSPSYALNGGPPVYEVCNFEGINDGVNNVLNIGTSNTGFRVLTRIGLYTGANGSTVGSNGGVERIRITTSSVNMLSPTSVSGGLTVIGMTVLGSASGLTRTNGDSSTNLATTAFVNASNGASEVWLGTFNTSNGSDLVINNFATTYDFYTMRFTNIVPVTNNSVILFTISQDNGSSFAASSYRWSNDYVLDNVLAYNQNANTSDTAIQFLSVGMLNTGNGMSGLVEMQALGGTTLSKTFITDTNGYSAAGAWYRARGTAEYYGSVGAINGFKFSSSLGGGLKAGGKVSIYGHRSS